MKGKKVQSIIHFELDGWYKSKTLKFSENIRNKSGPMNCEYTLEPKVTRADNCTQIIIEQKYKYPLANDAFKRTEAGANPPSEKPFENFKDFYYASVGCTDINKDRYRRAAYDAWLNLTAEERIPFVADAIIAKGNAGKIDLNNKRQVRRAMKNMRNIYV
ncbi:uncharacterized protein LOC119683901 [Teleopsis dalmanni]|uniref:uncharacterized protein LOC119683901 n=1 Tax=Teleopsis dalmanni TaxID=139649 RepID=UPI0018CE417C|nr:uncharacterized protein LOC119683901 [Teleopsis dalmanni]